MTTICLLYPDLLGTYGDGGNALALAERARRRGIDVESVSVTARRRGSRRRRCICSAGERTVRNAWRPTSFGRRRSSQRVRDGAHVLAVCAGLQILGTVVLRRGR